MFGTDVVAKIFGGDVTSAFLVFSVAAKLFKTIFILLFAVYGYEFYRFC